MRATEPINNEILVVNAHFLTGREGKTLQAVACRMRGEANGKTIKVSPHLFGKDIPLPGECVYVETGDIESDPTSNYRTMRNGKLSINRSDVHPAESVEPPIF